MISLLFFSNGYSDIDFWSDGKLEKDFYLQKIQITNKTKKLKTIDLKHETVGKYRFLSSVLEAEKPPYIFEYNTTGLPLPKVYSLDHWGYWNGGSNYNELEFVENADLSTTGYYTFNESGKKSTQSSFADHTLITQIQYPTGGLTKISYEVNTYAARVELFVPDQFTYKLVDKTGICGGARVKEISEYIEGKVENKRVFYYVNNYASQANPISSGILKRWPRYYSLDVSITDELRPDFQGTRPVYKVSRTLTHSSFNGNYNSTDPHILYSEIAEVNSDKSYIIHKFSTYKSNPDINDYLHKFPGDYYSSKPAWASNKGLNKNNDASRFRANKLEEQYYNNQKKLVKQNTFEYTVFNANNYIAGIRVDRGVAQAYKIYYDPCLLIEKTEKEINPVVLEKKTTYLYNADHMIKSETTINSANQTLSTLYRYVPEFLTISLDYLKMKAMNMVGIPIETIHYNNGKVITANVTLYAANKTANQILPIKQLKLNTDKAIAYTPLKVESTGLKLDVNLKDEIQFNSYDDKSNLTQYTDKLGIPICYLWGYNKQYPVAKVIGATYTDVVSKITATELDNISKGTYNDADMRTILDKIRTAFTGNKAIQITTYTYTPLVGMTSETDTNGVTTYYEYDGLGRLINIRDSGWNVLKAHDYHYGTPSLSWSPFF